MSPMTQWNRPNNRLLQQPGWGDKEQSFELPPSHQRGDVSTCNIAIAALKSPTARCTEIPRPTTSPTAERGGERKAGLQAQQLKQKSTTSHAVAQVMLLRCLDRQLHVRPDRSSKPNPCIFRNSEEGGRIKCRASSSAQTNKTRTTSQTAAKPAHFWHLNAQNNNVEHHNCGSPTHLLFCNHGAGEGYPGGRPSIQAEPNNTSNSSATSTAPTSQSKQNR